jgi:hypothetical protein
MEGDIINLLFLLVKYKYENYFEKLCESIHKTSLLSFRSINSYVI